MGFKGRSADRDSVCTDMYAYEKNDPPAARVRRPRRAQRRWKADCGAWSCSNRGLCFHYISISIGLSRESYVCIGGNSSTCQSPSQVKSSRAKGGPTHLIDPSTTPPGPNKPPEHPPTPPPRAAHRPAGAVQKSHPPAAAAAALADAVAAAAAAGGVVGWGGADALVQARGRRGGRGGGRAGAEHRSRKSGLRKGAGVLEGFGWCQGMGMGG